MPKEKALRIELARENPVTSGYLYSTLDLPAEEHEIRDALQRARIGRENGVYHDITIVDSPYAYDLQDMRLDSPTIDELNFLSKRLSTLNETERLAYAAVLPKAIGDDDIVSMKTLINCTYGLDDVMIASNVSTDEQLGQFVIENELHGDINAVPEQSLPLLDRRKVGELYRTQYGCVYTGGLTVFAGEYTIPEIYDGKQLPETEITEWYAFRLLLTEPEREGVEERSEESEWVTLPIDPAKADEIALKFEVGYIEDCDCIGFESSIPQITNAHFTDMDDFEKLNLLAERMLEMSPEEQIKFKAALEAEKHLPHLKIDGILDIAENLNQYQLYAYAADESDFFKAYLRVNLAVGFDPQWLDSLHAYNEGVTLVDRLGATLTPYGVVSARGRSLYELVPYDTVQEKELTTQALTDEKLEVVEVLGQTALFTNGRVTQSELPDGMYKYDLREGEGIAFATIEPVVKYDHGGTVLLKAPLDFGDAEYFVFDEDNSPNFLGYELTPREFMETDFTQTEDEDQEQTDTPAMQIGGMQT